MNSNNESSQIEDILLTEERLQLNKTESEHSKISLQQFRQRQNVGLFKKQCSKHERDQIIQKRSYFQSSWMVNSQDKAFNIAEVTSEDNIMTIKKKIQFQNLLKEKRIISQNPKFKGRIKLYKKMRIPRHIAMFLFIILEIFQKPTWCAQDEWKYSDNCEYILDSGDSYYLSGVAYMPCLCFSILQLVLILFLVLNKIIRFQFTKASRARRIRLSIYLLSCITCALQVWDYQLLWINNLLTPLVLVLYYRYLRLGMVTYFGYIYTSLPLIFIGFINIVLFAFLGKYIFYELYNTTSFGTLVFNLFVLQTTCNFPDIMMSPYINNRLAFLFFFTFLVINYIILMNMLVGMVYMNYKHFLQSRSISFKDNPRLQGIFDKYIDSASYKTQKITGQLTDYLLLASNSRRFTNSSKKVINSSQRRRQSIILQSSKNDYEVVQIDEEEKTLRQLSIVNMIFDIFNIIMHVMNLAMVVILYLEYFLYEEYDKKQYYSYKLFHPFAFQFLYFSIVFYSIIGIESIVKLILIHKKILPHRESRLMMYHELVCFLVFVPLVICFHLDLVTLYQLQLLLLPRLTRLVWLILQIKVVWLIVMSILNILPQFLDHLCVLFSVYLLFSSIAMQSFGGVLKKQLDYEKHGFDPRYAANNFNDLPTAFVTCFELTIVNNWHVIAKIHAVFTGTQYALVFFVIFYLFSVTFGIQIIVAIIIEWMIQTMSYIKTQANIKQKEII